MIPVDLHPTMDLDCDDDIFDTATENFAMHQESYDGPSLSQLDMELVPIAEETRHEVLEEIDLPDQPSDSYAPQSESIPLIPTTRENNLSTSGPPAEAAIPPPSGPHLVKDVDSDDNDPDPIDIRNEESDYDDVASNLYNFFDESDDYDPAELQSITSHRYLNGILEFEVMYTDGETKWHLITLVKDDDACAVATYVLTGPISNAKHRRWARSFLQSLRCMIRCMRRSSYMDGFEAKTYHSTPTKVRSRCSVKARQSTEHSEEKKNVNQSPIRLSSTVLKYLRLGRISFVLIRPQVTSFGRML